MELNLFIEKKFEYSNSLVVKWQVVLACFCCLEASVAQKPWLQLTDYSNKYAVSMSTLRRRIKENSIDYRLDGGKYFLTDEPPTMKPRGRKPSAQSSTENKSFFKEGSQIGSAVYFDSEEMAPVLAIEQNVTEVTNNKPNEPIFAAANRLLEELKKAYSQILQEKEEQILQLKEEIADLRTLAQVLESENERLRKKLE